ncbi:amidase [Paenibacillus glucanolyticus]|uniref:Amidase n=1 Tax=Paenibacillus glucanolyticus TaxID=59843 RepID=A0A163IFH1_9BACL|nr:amidase family protein [Paenibacillus glucanolyticus]KZS45944.1 amidase [Paenibacillus glucanolyticus]
MRKMTSWKLKGSAALLSASLLAGSFILTGTPAEASSSTSTNAGQVSSIQKSSLTSPITVQEFSKLLNAVAKGNGLEFKGLDGTGTIKRKDAAAAIYEWIELPESTSEYTDLSEAESEIAGALLKAGIMNGYSSTVFAPNQPVTISDAHVLIDRIEAYLTPFDITEATIAEMQTAMEQGKVTSVTLVQLYLARIHRYDDQLHAILTVNDKAVEAARKLDEERRATGPRGPLHGIPIIVKDNYDTADMPTTAGCVCLKDSIPDNDSEQVARLKAAGAIIIAKANLDEFAFNITTSSSLGGQTLNPYNLGHYPGGSSGGTGAAIAANFAAAGLGTDTGGSIRIPSSLNSLVGIRPTIGLSSRDGIIPLALTQDVGGPMARTVADAAAVLEATAGYDAKDLVTTQSVGRVPDSYLSYLDKEGLQGARIGVVTQLLSGTKAEQNEVNDITLQAVKDMEKLGATAVHIEIPNYEAIMKFPSLSGWEFKFQLNDYLESLGEDAPYHSLEEIIASGEYLESHKSSMEARQARETLDDNEYRKIVLDRTKLTQESLLKVMAEHNLDALVYPASAEPAGKLGEGQNSGVNNRLSPFSGFPAITVPAGFTDGGLPVGVEFLGKAFDEGTLIKLAYSYEQGTLHRKSPALTP